MFSRRQLLINILCPVHIVEQLLVPGETLGQAYLRIKAEAHSVVSVPVWCGMVGHGGVGGVQRVGDLP